jgi:hypothetical protein
MDRFRQFAALMDDLPRYQQNIKNRLPIYRAFGQGRFLKAKDHYDARTAAERP